MLIRWRRAAGPRREWNDPTTQNTALCRRSMLLMRCLLSDQTESLVAPRTQSQPSQLTFCHYITSLLSKQHVDEIDESTHL